MSARRTERSPAVAGRMRMSACMDEPMQIVAAKRAPRFWYLLSPRGRYDAGAAFVVEEIHVRKWIAACVGVALLVSGEALCARQSASGSPPASTGRQTETDEYTRYELLAP